MTDLAFTPIPTNFEKSITLVTGDTEAVLIDAGFSLANGHRAVAAVLDSGRILTHVVITAGDPDFYFGAEVISEAFPDAVFIATPDVIEHITATFADKVTMWRDFLGPNAPTRIVPLTPFDGDRIPIDGHELQLHNADVDPHDRGWYLFEPASRTIVGGILVAGGTHVWTADTPTAAARAEWVTALDRLEAHDPTRVIGSHLQPGFPTDIRAIQHTREYLGRFEVALAFSTSSAEVEQRLLAAYPDAQLAIAASIGPQVARGELAWG